MFLLVSVPCSCQRWSRTASLKWSPTTRTALRNSRKLWTNCRRTWVDRKRLLLKCCCHRPQAAIAGRHQSLCGYFTASLRPPADALLRCEQLRWLEELHARRKLCARLLLHQRDHVLRTERHDGPEQSLPEGKVGCFSRDVASLFPVHVSNPAAKLVRIDFQKTQLNTEMLPSKIRWVSGEDATFKREENCEIKILCRATVKGGSG